MDLDLGCVSSFLVLVEEGHFGRAASRLHVSPSALTKRVQRLERQLGVPLLVRSTAGVAALTAAGARFATHAVPLLAAASAARAAVVAEPVALTVRLGVPGRVGDFPERQLLTEVAGLLWQRYPDVRLACRSVSVADPYVELLEGAVDVVWGAVAAAPAAVETAPVVDLERIGVVPSAHELADLQEVDPAVLAEYPLLCITGAPAQLVHQFTLGDVRPARDARLVPVTAADGESVLRQLRPGQAAVVPTSTWASRVATPGLRRLRLPGLDPVPIFVGYRRSERRQPVHGLVQLLAHVAGSRSRTAERV